MTLTLLICTYNRAQILQDCLSSLVQQTADSSTYQVIIINNNSTDNTEEIIKHFTNQYPNFRSVIEPKQGLSHARNRGYQEAKTTWVAYLDDDAKAQTNYVERALWAIENYNFDCFGGMYYAWHKFGKPKWLPDDFGTKDLLQKEVGILEKGMLSGGNMLFKKSVLEAVKGFDTQLGMKGTATGYCEDDYLIMKLRQHNYTIGFDPELKIDHLVMPHKLKPWWHISSYYAKGRDDQKMYQNSFMVVLLQTIRSFVGILIKKMPFNLYRWCFQANYYWQNALIDTFQIAALRLGQLSVFMPAIFKKESI